MRNPAVPVRFVVAVTAVLAVTACATQRFDGPDGDRRFYEARCGVCHVPWQREQFAATEWPGILDIMAPRAGLTKAQRERVHRYLTAR
jgi:hypothetical protein